MTGGSGMPGWRKGKNINEVMAIPDWPKYAYSPVMVQGYSFSELAEIAEKGGLDIRHIDSLMFNALVYKDDADIDAFASNMQTIDRFGGWPDRETIKKINAQRVKIGKKPTVPDRPRYPGATQEPSK